jgi:N-acetyl-gamma-glutamyl-phosphate reductase
VSELHLGQAGGGAGPRVAVIGASGFAGALAAHLLWRHPGFALVRLTGRSEIGHIHADIYPRYRVPLPIEELDLERQEDLAAAILAYPHGVAAPVVAALRERDIRVLDLSADFRLRELASYEAHYGKHAAPALLGSAVYGLPELHRERIAQAQLVAGPGCFPTAALLALAPLARAGLIEDVVIDAKTGVSGAGRAPSPFTHFSAAGENVTPYRIASHRHTPEIEEQLAEMGAKLAVQFQPHLVPLDQGELLSCYVTPTRAVGEHELAELFAESYAGEHFIEPAALAPTIRDVRESNFCRIHACADQHTGKLLIFAAIDNLWKGTSAQALQCLNLMFGYPESEGLI